MEREIKENSECCPKFEPAPWEERTLNFTDKLFVTDKVTCLFHIPLNMGQVMTRMMKNIETAKATPSEFFMLASDSSPWASEQFIPVEKEVPGMKHVKLSGTFVTKVFEGPYKEAKFWYPEMFRYAETLGKKASKVYFYYTTCPKCAKKYGKNYVVGVAQVA